MTSELAIPGPRRRRPPFRLPGGTAGQGAVSIALFLALWWFATAGLGFGDQTTIASPPEVVRALVRLTLEPFGGLTLPGHVAASLYRWGLGVLLAVGIGVPLGLAMAWQPAVNAAVAPIFEPLRNIPPLAWIPLVIVWLGTGTASQVTLVFVGAFPPCVLNAFRAIRGVDPVLLAAARNLGAPSHRQLLEVALPSGLPTILAGIRIAFGNGWMALVGAELVGAPSGLGYLIVRGQENLSAPVIFAGMIVIGALGLLLDATLRAAGWRLVPWRREAGGDAA